ncbi:hypothetical protein Tco_0234601, partial [Tanacetum coccineum]
LAMPSHSHKKFRWGSVFATGCRKDDHEEGYGRVSHGMENIGNNQGGHCHQVSRGIKLALEEEVNEKEELKEVWEKMEYVISDSDSDLESTASS